MKTSLTLIVIMLSLLFVPFVGADDDDNPKDYFIGLWQGVDPLDGSEALRSIIKNKDGTFKITGSESFFSGCGSDRGIVEATGYVKRYVLRTEDATLTCFEDNTVFDIELKYVPDRKNGTLVEVTGGGFPPVVLHRIDNRYNSSSD